MSRHLRIPVNRGRKNAIDFHFGVCMVEDDGGDYDDDDDDDDV